MTYWKPKIIVDTPSRQRHSCWWHYVIMPQVRGFRFVPQVRGFGDLQGVSQPSASRIVKTVSTAIAGKRAGNIRFPTGEEATETKRKFYEMHGFPDVLGCVDGVHVPIQAPSLDEREIYRCRKGFMSLNVQGIAYADLKFINIVNRWPGSTHDSRIFDNSRICFQFEQNDIDGLLLGDKGYPCRPFLMTALNN